MNKVFLYGNMGKDPELRYSKNSKPILNFSMATVESIKKGDNWEDQITWHNIVMIGRNSEYLSNNLSKGKKVTVEGKIKNRQYEDKQGNKKYITEILADRIEFESQKLEKKHAQNNQNDIDDDDDLPF